MKLKFKNQGFQEDATAAVCDVFAASRITPRIRIRLTQARSRLPCLVRFDVARILTYGEQDIDRLTVCAFLQAAGYLDGMVPNAILKSIHD